MEKRKNEPRKDRRMIVLTAVLIPLSVLIIGVVWALTYKAPYQEPQGLPMMASYEGMCDPIPASYVTAYPTQISIHCATASYYHHTLMTNRPIALTQASIARTAQAQAIATETAQAIATETAQAVMTRTP